jgi:hypothetical protein
MFIGRVREKLGHKARVEAEKLESRETFRIGIEDIVGATAREYGKGGSGNKREKKARRGERVADGCDL